MGSALGGDYGGGMRLVRAELATTRSYAVNPKGMPWRPIKLRIWFGSRCLAIGLRSKSIHLTRRTPDGLSSRWIVKPRWKSS